MTTTIKVFGLGFHGEWTANVQLDADGDLTPSECARIERQVCGSRDCACGGAGLIQEVSGERVWDPVTGREFSR